MYFKKIEKEYKNFVRVSSISLIHWLVYANVIIHLSVGAKAQNIHLTTFTTR